MDEWLENENGPAVRKDKSEDDVYPRAWSSERDVG